MKKRNENEKMKRKKELFESKILCCRFVTEQKRHCGESQRKGTLLF